MDPEKKDKILADIKKTGFVTELNTASILLKHDWKVSQNSSYLDKDQDKSREIDIVAQKFDFEAKFRFRQEFYVAIEVKSSAKPWVIFTTSENNELLSSQDWQNLFSAENLLVWRHLGRDDIKKEFMRASCYRIGTTFHEAFKGPNQPSQIFEAVISACKAVTFMKESFEEIRGVDLNDLNSYNPKEYHFLGVFVPLIVVDGELFDAHLNDEGEIELEEKDYIPLKFSYSSPKYKRQSLSSNAESLNYLTFFPDIVTFKGLDAYLQKLDFWRDVIFNDIQTQLDTDEWFADTDKR